MTSATAAVMIAISAILMGAAPSLVCFYVGRIIGGLANGMVMTNIAVYMSEIAPAYSRGFVTGIVATFFGTGNIVAACIALGFSYLQNEIEWRGTYIILAALSVIMLASLFFIPESPRWLIEKGRDDEAWTVLQRIHRIKNDPDSVRLRFHLRSLKPNLACVLICCRKLQKRNTFKSELKSVRRKLCLEDGSIL